jgi:hypothetical protein
MVHSVIERYRDQWIAVDDDDVVVAHHASFEALHEALAQMPPIHVVIRRIPRADEPMFVGTW